MHTLAQPRLTAPAAHRAADRALIRWFPWCNPKVAQAIHIVRPHYPLIEGGNAAAPRVCGAPDGGLAA